MKKIALAVAVILGMSAMCHADLFSENAKIVISGVTLQIPLNNLSVISMVSLWGQPPVTMVGGETKIVTWKAMSAGVVVVTSGDNKGSWGGSLNVDWAKLLPAYPIAILDIGLFGAQNWETNTYLVGIKASQRFW